LRKKNEEIRENNKMLSALSTLYNQMYEVFGKDCGDKKNGGSWKTVELKEKKLKEYLTDTVKASIDCNYVKFTDLKINGEVYKGACCNFQHSTFNKSGDKEKDKGGQTDNIDVHEQAAINMVSMWQDQVRMYGDELSTDAQLMTTKMEQYIQNGNSSLTTCTQVVKAVGDLCKAITQNIR
jgi:hypothetical protein